MAASAIRERLAARERELPPLGHSRKNSGIARRDTAGSVTEQKPDDGDAVGTEPSTPVPGTASLPFVLFRVLSTC